VVRFTTLVGRPPTEPERSRLNGVAKSNATLYEAWLAAGRSRPASATRSNQVIVLIPFRNNTTYIRSGALRRVLLAVISGLGRRRRRPSFWFYENDSSDDTPMLLRGTVAWLETQGFAVTLTSEKTAEPAMKGGERSSARCRRIARCRNGLVGAALEELIKADLALWIDTNVVVRPRDVVALLAALQADSGLGVATGATMMGDGPSRGTHYYDTYAHSPVTTRRKSMPGGWTFQACPSRLCQKPKCKRAQQDRYCAPITPGGNRVVPVASAFGGFAAMRTAALLQARWSSVNNLCEHVAFCAMVRQAGYTVAIVEQACGQWFR
jgi:hypothetical protein